ncbi:MAG TPA: phosphotransferase [Nocardioidaceae bacterium]|nr:phosphotransferase [Nocardioidaceae bacterium]
MTPGAASAGATERVVRRSGLAEHLAEPLLRNGYALVLNSGTTALVGMLFWLVAARTYSSAVVGIGAATLAAMTTLSTIAQLNLSNALSRFLPVAGGDSRRLVRRCYTATAVVAAVAGAVFVWGTRWWSPSLSFLAEDLRVGVWFVTALVLWSLFVVQDGALSGLRRSTWVLGKNTVYAVTKVVCLLVPAVAVSEQGIFLAWTIPVAPILVGVNVLMFRRLVPREGATVGSARPRDDRVVTRFVAADYVVALAGTGLTSALPIIVLEGVGAAAAAYFTLAFSISYALYMVSRSMGTSLLVEGATDPRQLARISYRTMVHTAALLVPLVLGVVLTAPLLLRIFGQEYSSGGSTALRLLALAVLPAAVVVVYTAVERVRRNMRALVVATLVINGSALVAVLVLLQVSGLVGVVTAWLVTQTCAAAVLLVRALGPMWIPVLGPRADALVLRPARGVKSLLRRTSQRRQFADRYPQVSRAAGLDPTWRVRRVIPTVGDVAVALVGGDRPAAVLKVSRTACGDRALDHAVSVVHTLSDDPRLVHWAGVLPVTRACGHLDDGRLFVVEDLVEGIRGTTAVADPSLGDAPVTAVLDVATELHRLTGRRVVVDDALLERWVDRPSSLLAALAEPGEKAALRRLGAQVREQLGGLATSVSWTHGDLSPGNVVLDATDMTVRGLLDWERAMPDALPEIDVRHLALTVRMERTRRELGDLVCEDLICRQGSDLDQALTLLVWLHHVSGICDKTSRYPARSVWWTRNVAPVLARAE